MTSIGIFLFPGVEELDFAGPWEVLKMWADQWPDDGVRVVTVARTDAIIECAKGLRVLPDHTWSTAPAFDVLIVPGGRGTRTLLGDEATYEWLRSVSSGGALMTSVCTGSLLFADLGLLDGMPATTHWSTLDTLAELGASIDVRPDDRFVDAGEVITASGVSAGIDMALYLVVRLHSTERATAVRRAIQYDPLPPV